MRRIALAVALVALSAAMTGATESAAARVPLPPRFPTVIHAPCPDTATPCYMPGIAPTLAGEWECQDALAGCISLPSLSHRFAKWHELGHAFDHQILDDRDRVRLSRLLGTGRVPWLTGPNELFADAYATCAIRGDDIRIKRAKNGRVVGTVESGSYGFQPTPIQHRRICQAIRFTALG
jgi:hypothetical protein